ncbi:MAG TPA: hypothetical protein VHR66_20095, partial [Gemmataceae bacterium]|nr:hypothetical protein [Gemmataceae bacterium]
MSFRNPYPGLRRFDVQDADLFFGRDEQVDRILQRLGDNRFLALVGASGCGKSSLARAGMMSALMAGRMTQVGAGWRIAAFEPGARPLSNLADALVRAGWPADASKSDAAADARDGILANLRRGPFGLAKTVSEYWGPNATRLIPDGRQLLLLVDQFEEIFRFHRDHDPNEAAAFVALLLRTAKTPSLPVYVVLTMRSDYLGDCVLFSDLPEAISDSQFLIPRLTREQTREAIELPARVEGGEVKEDLVRRLLNDMGDDFDQLPLMQHALMRLWDKAIKADPGPAGPILDLEKYGKMVGKTNALDHHGQEIYKGLATKQQRLTEVMFRCLCEPDPGEQDIRRRDVRRPVKVQVVADVAETPVAEVEKVADAFRATGVNFLTPAPSVPLTADKLLDISHESLIRQWQSLKNWVAEEAQWADKYRRLVDTAIKLNDNREEPLSHAQLREAEEWRDRVRPTSAWAKRYFPKIDEGGLKLVDNLIRKSKRADLWRLWKNQAFVFVCLVCFVFVGLTIWAVTATGEARRQEKEAHEQEQKAHQQEVIATAKTKEAENQTGIAKAEKEKADSETKRAQTLLIGIQAHNAAALEPGKALALAVEATEQSRKSDQPEILPEAALGLRQAMVNLGGLPVGYLPNRRLSKVVTATNEQHEISWVCIADSEGEMFLWQAPIAAARAGKLGGTPIWLGKNSRPAFKRLLVSSNGRWLIAQSREGEVRLWDLTAKFHDKLDGIKLETPNQEKFGELTLDSDGEWICAKGLGKTSNDVTLQLWDLTQTNPNDNRPGSFKCPVDDSFFRNVAFARKVKERNRWLAVFRADGTPFVVNLAQVKAGDSPIAKQVSLPKTQNKSASAMRSGEFSIDGSYLAVVCSDGSVLRWSLTSGRPWETVPEQFSLSADSGKDSNLATTSAAQKLQSVITDARGIWAIAVSRPTANIDPMTSVENVDDLPNPQTGRGLTGVRNGIGNLYDLSAASAKGWRLKNVSPTNSTQVVVAQGGRRVLVRCSEAATSVIRLWTWNNNLETEDGSERYGDSTDLLQSEPYMSQTGEVTNFKVSEDGRWLVAPGPQNIIRVWDLWFAATEPPVNLCGHDAAVTGVELTSDGRWLVSIAGDGSVRAWDLGQFSRTVEPLILGNPSCRAELIRSPRGARRVMMVDANREVRTWNPSTDDAITEYAKSAAPESEALVDFALSKDKRWVLVRNSDQTSQLWKLGEGQPVRRGRLAGWVDEEFMVSNDERWLAGISGFDGAALQLWPIVAGDDVGTRAIRYRMIARPIEAANIPLGFSASNQLVVSTGTEINAWNPTAIPIYFPTIPLPVPFQASSEMLIKQTKPSKSFPVGNDRQVFPPVIALGGKTIVMFQQGRGAETFSWSEGTGDPKGRKLPDPPSKDKKLEIDEKPLSWMTSVYRPDVSADGRWLVAKRRNNQGFYVWNLAGNLMPCEDVSLPTAPKGSNLPVGLSAPDRDWLAIGANSAIHVWYLGGESEPRRTVLDLSDIDGTKFNFRSARFSPDGNWLIVFAIPGQKGIDEQVALLWKLNEQLFMPKSTPIKVSVGDLRGRFEVNVSHDRWFTLAARNVSVWDLNGITLRPTELSLGNAVTPKIFVDPKGERILQIGPEGAASLATLDGWKLFERAKTAAVRNLSD